MHHEPFGNGHINDTFALYTKDEDGYFWRSNIFINATSYQSVERQELLGKVEWYGVTYNEDKPSIVAFIKSLVNEGEYPNNL